MTSSLDVLVLGGTSWLGGSVARHALSRGHRVTCLARGRSGSVPDGARLVPADRWVEGAYDEVGDQKWDAVVEVSWQPELVRSALTALAGRTRHWIYVSSGSVYPDGTDAGSAATVPPWTGTGQVGIEDYPGAKVSCETACLEAVGPDRLLVARAGLIAGYGDRSDRFGYWPARVAAVSTEDEVVLVPPLETPVQVIDVEDLAAWLVSAAENRTAGTFDAVGEPITFEDVLRECVVAAGTEPTVAEPEHGWLVEAGVAPWMGAESLPLWLPQPEEHVLLRRPTDPAKRAGLELRPLRDTVADSLAWERELGLGRERKAGLSRERERDLLTSLLGPGD